jgi:hypothetical protein
MTQRTQAEIQRAHDILNFLVSPDAPEIYGPDGAKLCHAVHDALAWVLGYPCGESFQTNLDNGLEMLRQLGYQEVDVGHPISSDEARERGLT